MILDILNTLSGFFLLFMFAFVLLIGTLGLLANIWDGVALLHNRLKGHERQTEA